MQPSVHYYQLELVPQSKFMYVLYAFILYVIAI